MKAVSLNLKNQHSANKQKDGIDRKNDHHRNRFGPTSVATVDYDDSRDQQNATEVENHQALDGHAPNSQEGNHLLSIVLLLVVLVGGDVDWIWLRSTGDWWFQ